MSALKNRIIKHRGVLIWINFRQARPRDDALLWEKRRPWKTRPRGGFFRCCAKLNQSHRTPLCLQLFVPVFQYPEHKQQQDGAERDGNPDSVGDIEDTWQCYLTIVSEVDQWRH